MDISCLAMPCLANVAEV